MMSEGAKVTLTACIIALASGLAMISGSMLYELRDGYESGVAIIQSWGVAICILAIIIAIWFGFLEWKDKKR